MKLWNVRAGFGVALLSGVLALATAGCEPAVDDGGVSETDRDQFESDQIVGANSVGRRVAVQGHVLVRVGATTTEIATAVRSQMRALFGAARASDIGLSERMPVINTASFVRDTVSVVDPARPTAAARAMLRVRYTYRTRAVVPRALETNSTVNTTTLFGSYGPYAREIINTCQIERTQELGASTIWYHFNPTLTECQSAIGAEATRIDADRRQLSNPDRQVTVSEVSRRYLPVVLQLTPLEANEAAYPEYNRLYEDGRFVAYSFFGLDEANDPWDYGGRNYFTYLRTLRAAQPALQVTSVSGGANLLAVSWHGAPIANVTYDRVATWILDARDYPAQVAEADVSDFRLQILRQWRDHYVTLGMTAQVTTSGVTRAVPIEIRTYYGDEESMAAAAAAVRRYTAAFAEADVFQYTGHSHLGSGPLDPGNYRAANFPNRYQIMMVNSCVSYNYYNGFFTMHPGGSANLDTITNGIEVYLEGAGLSSARFMTAMIDGRFRSYLDVLTSMRVDLPWEPAHDPHRVADGELDNQFTPARFPMTLQPTR